MCKSNIMVYLTEKFLICISNYEKLLYNYIRVSHNYIKNSAKNEIDINLIQIYN